MNASPCLGGVLGAIVAIDPIATVGCVLAFNCENRQCLTQSARACFGCAECYRGVTFVRATVAVIHVATTTSAGLEDRALLIARADAAMYVAKARGRNEVCVSRGFDLGTPSVPVLQQEQNWLVANT